MFLRKTLSLLLLFSGPLLSETVTTEPVGYNKVTCLANSDTIVGVPLRVQGSITTKLVAAPVVDPENSDLVTLTLHNSELPAYTPSTRYLKFNGGAADGRWYDITANTTNSVTIDLNGDILPAVAADNSVIIAAYWTLDSLFPPTGATTSWTETPAGSGNWVPNGHAIVASTNAFSSGRRTEILLPNLTGVGTNLSSSGTFYLFNGGWRKQGQSVTSNFGAQVLYPDNYFTIRHPLAVAHATTFRSLGEVETKSFIIPLNTRSDGKQDNFIGLIRPVGLRLQDLALGGTPAFMTSESAFSSGRRDELLVFNNQLAAQNKSASATYYYFNGAWRRQGQPVTTDAGSDIIPAGWGFLIRKYQVSGGLTAYWINTSSY